jgi:hypothetical protein
MSLSIPYVLRAALETAPGLPLIEEDGIDVNAAERLSRQAAQELWLRGYQPVDSIPAAEPVAQLSRRVVDLGRSGTAYRCLSAGAVLGTGRVRAAVKHSTRFRSTCDRLNRSPDNGFAR